MKHHMEMEIGMYRIMLADDEGIVIDSLQYIIERNFKEECSVESAKTGRNVIELAENFRPDIAIMDIQMPGINGIDAIREMKKVNSNTIFIIMSAYDKFDYAKEAINLGVLEYLNKPVDKDVIVETLKKAMAIIDQDREKRSNDLKIREKMETVVPIIESGLIYTVLFQEDYSEETSKYQELLGIQESYGYMMVVEGGENLEGDHLTNVIGTGVKIQNLYIKIREILKEFFHCIVGPIMANKIIVFVPNSSEVNDYNTRINIIEQAQKMVDKLNVRIDAQFRIGIGSVKPLHELSESYKEALNSIKLASGPVAHVKDLPIGCVYEEDYPIEIEKSMFEDTIKGEVTHAMQESQRFFDWMVSKHPDNMMGIRLKSLEFVLWAEHLAYESGGMTYHFDSRNDYLPVLMDFSNYEDMKHWFVSKIGDATRNVITKKDEQSSGLIERAKKYINTHFKNDISLDEISREIDISPYYFSKLFKEETGENFIEYLTTTRMEYAKSLILKSNLNMKEICAEVGYQDPNYFSRIFKKTVGVTPTEYKEGNGES